MATVQIKALTFDVRNEQEGARTQVAATCSAYKETLRLEPRGVHRRLAIHVDHCVVLQLRTRTLVSTTLHRLGGQAETAPKNPGYLSTNGEALLRAQQWERGEGKRYFVKCRNR